MGHIVKHLSVPCSIIVKALQRPKKIQNAKQNTKLTSLCSSALFYIRILCCRVELWASSIILHCSSSPSCI